MILATSKELCSKEDVVRIAKSHFSRWHIEEYFRAKKQLFVIIIDSLNFYLSICIAFLARISNRMDMGRPKTLLIERVASIRKKGVFYITL